MSPSPSLRSNSPVRKHVPSNDPAPPFLEYTVAKTATLLVRQHPELVVSIRSKDASPKTVAEVENALRSVLGGREHIKCIQWTSVVGQLHWLLMLSNPTAVKAMLDERTTLADSGFIIDTPPAIRGALRDLLRQTGCHSGGNMVRNQSDFYVVANTESSYNASDIPSQAVLQELTNALAKLPLVTRPTTFSPPPASDPQHPLLATLRHVDALGHATAVQDRIRDDFIAGKNSKGSRILQAGEALSRRALQVTTALNVEIDKKFPDIDEPYMEALMWLKRTDSSS